MAAGRVDVSRRRDHNGYSKKYFDCDRNGSVERDVVYKNGYHVSSDTSSFYFRRTGISCRDAERVSCYFQDGSILDPSSRLEDGEIPKNDDGILLPPEKKRKFSPIVWDLDDKVQLKNSVVPATSAVCSPSPLNACGKGLNDATGAGVAKYAVPEAATRTMDLELVSGEMSPTRGSGSGSESPEILFPSSPVKKYSIDPQDQQDEGGELAEARNISMSRWASEDDSPMDANISGDQEIRKESDDDRVEVLGGYRFKSSGSGGRASSSGSGDEDEYFRDRLKDDDSSMDTDGSLDENDDVNRMHDGSSEVKELNSSAQRGINMLEGCRSVYDYEKLHQINEGTYGVVYKARDKKAGNIVALKKVKMNVGGDRNLEDYGFPLSALREINILASFHHPSIVNVKEIVMSGLDGVFMVMEYMEHDLKGLMQAMKQPFSTSEVKCLMLQLLQGVKYLHDNWVLHRDLKTSNLLVNDKGELKICDFGMSRQYGSPLKPYTSLVVTLWYRAPELLLGAKQYSTAIDMWSVGCIMAELLGKEPLFKGKSEIDQLTKIFRVLGTPSEAIWPGFSKLPGSKANFVKQPYNLLRKKFPKTSFTGSPVLSESGFDLLNKLLAYDPEKRITVDEALSHAWFLEDPHPQYKELKLTPSQCVSKR